MSTTIQTSSIELAKRVRGYAPTLRADFVIDGKDVRAWWNIGMYAEGGHKSKWGVRVG